MHPGAANVQQALLTAGAKGEVQMLPTAVRTAVQAAEALGVPVGAIVKSLIFEADGAPLLVLTSGANQVDTAKVAALSGVAAIQRASPEFVRTHTGQPIGGVAPVGHPSPVRTLVDQDLGQYEEIWAAGGIPHAVFPTNYDELVRITDGIPSEVA